MCLILKRSSKFWIAVWIVSIIFDKKLCPDSTQCRGSDSIKSPKQNKLLLLSSRRQDISRITGVHVLKILWKPRRSHETPGWPNSFPATNSLLSYIDHWRHAGRRFKIFSRTPLQINGGAVHSILDYIYTLTGWKDKGVEWDTQRNYRRLLH